MARTFTPQTVEAARTLGILIAAGRRERRWSRAELAERLGVTAKTVTKVERGELGVAVGTVLEAAVITGVTLFGPDPAGLRTASALAEARLAVLPARVRAATRRVDDDF